jgi:hypothetical protein
MVNLIPTHAAERTPLPASAESPANVQLRWQSSMTSVRIDRPFTALAILQNLESQRRVVMRGNPGFRSDGGLQLRVVDASRSNRQIDAPRGELTPTEVRDSGRMLLLAPQESYSMLIKVPARQLFAAPGRYELYLEYASPLPGNGTRDSGGVEGATATSAALIIDVLP